jgi:lipopolysaccharide/colanic/teichoic acid biosynthesis glycosyltransferase
MIRVLDILLSGFGIILLAPLLIPVILILKFTGEGEVLYSQLRIGLNGESFNLFKFATMLKNSPNLDSGTITISNDRRILPFGKFLRASKINELPQLINVFIGDMSLIGPRPLTPPVFAIYPPSVRAELATVRPGLSGIGSIVFRHEESILKDSDTINYYKLVLAPYKGELEEWYVKNRSLQIYVTAILLTLLTVLMSKSSLIWRVYPTLPPPPNSMRDVLNYIECGQ